MSSVDVVVPCYGYGHFLRECVQSVLSQSDVDVRVLIIDDASPDNTADIGTALSREDARVTFVRHEHNIGHIATYNEGIEWASSEYYVLLSADDYLLPGALSRAAHLMHIYAQVGFVFGHGIALYTDGTRRQLKTRLSKRCVPVMSGREFLLASGARNIVVTPTAVVRVPLQKSLGGYSSHLPHTADMKNWMCLAAHASVGFVDDFQAVYRRHASNMSISYRSAGGLLDLQQRQEALASFFDSCGKNLPGKERLHDELARRLGLDSLDNASQAFNLGDLGGSLRLSDFAYSITPELRASLPALKLGIKRWLGYRVCSALRNPAQGLRKVLR